MNILIAPDKFKGSLSAIEVCEAIASGLNQQEQSFNIRFHPMADGGDGSMDILADHLGLKDGAAQGGWWTSFATTGADPAPAARSKTRQSRRGGTGEG